jgi:hypothetical protein
MPQSSKPWLIRQYSDPSLIWAKRPFRLNNRHPKRLPLFRRPKSTNGGRSSVRPISPLNDRKPSADAEINLADEVVLAGECIRALSCPVTTRGRREIIAAKDEIEKA